MKRFINEAGDRFELGWEQGHGWEAERKCVCPESADVEWTLWKEPHIWKNIPVSGKVPKTNLLTPDRRIKTATGVLDKHVHIVNMRLDKLSLYCALKLWHVQHPSICVCGCYTYASFVEREKKSPQKVDQPAGLSGQHFHHLCVLDTWESLILITSGNIWWKRLVSRNPDAPWNHCGS